MGEKMDEQPKTMLEREIDTLGEHVRHLIGKLEARSRTQGDVDGRFVSIARTELQLGFMALRRAVAKPEREF